MPHSHLKILHTEIVASTTLEAKANIAHSNFDVLGQGPFYAHHGHFYKVTIAHVQKPSIRKPILFKKESSVLLLRCCLGKNRDYILMVLRI